MFLKLQTSTQTDKHTDKQTNRQTDAIKFYGLHTVVGRIFLNGVGSKPHSVGLDLCWTFAVSFCFCQNLAQAPFVITPFLVAILAIAHSPWHSWSGLRLAIIIIGIDYYYSIIGIRAGLFILSGLAAQPLLLFWLAIILLIKIIMIPARKIITINILILIRMNRFSDTVECPNKNPACLLGLRHYAIFK